MRFTFVSSVLAAVVASRAQQARRHTAGPVMNLQDTQDACRRAPPNIAFEWNDHDVWGWWYDVQAEYAASDADFYALWA